MDLALAGHRALVTGGTRRIGRAIAEVLAEVLAEEGCRMSFRARDGANVLRPPRQNSRTSATTP